MALVYTEDIMQTFAAAQKKFRERSAQRESDVLKWNLTTYKQLADDIRIEVEKFNRETSEFLQLRPLAANTLYRKLHYNFNKEATREHLGEDCRYDENTLNVLCFYAFDKLYRRRFLVLDKPPINTPSKSIGREIIAEFPIGEPAWPSTPTIKVKNKKFHDLYIKCENQNYTGTHKDRMAYEIASFYPQYVRTIKKGVKLPGNPIFSLITAGCAGIAIQSLFAAMNYPSLRVLVDNGIDSRIEMALENVGCHVYKTNLSEQPLSTEDILRLTDNDLGDGFDLTFTREISHVKLKYYDWLSYEIINQQPDYIFVPYGSGDLMLNILRRIQTELSLVDTGEFDPRLHVNILPFRNCRIFGATSEDPKSAMDKLYSAFFSENDNGKEVARLIAEAVVHEDSGVQNVKEKFLKNAFEIANENGIQCEASGIAGLALLLQMEEKLLKQDSLLFSRKILIVNTGRLKVEIFEDKRKCRAYLRWLRAKIIKRNSIEFNH